MLERMQANHEEMNFHFSRPHIVLTVALLDEIGLMNCDLYIHYRGPTQWLWVDHPADELVQLTNLIYFIGEEYDITIHQTNFIKQCNR